MVGLEGKLNKSAKFAITNGTIKAVYTTVGRTLSALDIDFTEEEIKNLHNQLKFTKMGDIDFPILESDKLTLKESILLSIFQYAHTFGKTNENYRQLLVTKFINKKFPAIPKVCTELTTIQENSEKAFKENIKEKDVKPQLTQSEQRIANVLDELGVFYNSNHRVGDVFKAQFYLPNENIVLEYVQMIDFIKTDDTKGDRIMGGRYLFRKKLFELLGYKVVNVSSFEVLDTDNVHSKLVSLLKERLNLKEKEN